MGLTRYLISMLGFCSLLASLGGVSWCDRLSTSPGKMAEKPCCIAATIALSRLRLDSAVKCGATGATSFCARVLSSSASGAVSGLRKYTAICAVGCFSRYSISCSKKATTLGVDSGSPPLARSLNFSSEATKTAWTSLRASSAKGLVG